MASRGEFRSVGLTQLDAWRQMFPTMFEGLDTSLPAVSPITGQKLTLVWNCLNVHGETTGSLPCSVLRYTENGPKPDYLHPVYRLLHERPNPYMTAFDFWSTVEKVKQIWGNAFVLIDNDGVEPIALYPLPSWDVNVKKTAGGELYYECNGKHYRHTDILHFKNYSVDGYCGISTITANQLSVGLGLKLKQYNSSLIGNRPHGYLTGPKPKDEMQKEQIKKQWNNNSGTQDTYTSSSLQSQTIQTNAFGPIPYLYGGVEFKALTLPADQAAYILGTELNDRDILGMFRMPPTMVSIYKDAPYNSSEQQDIAFVKYTKASLRNYEQECTEKLFPISNRRREKSWYVKFNLNGLLRGDMKARKEFYTALFNIASLSANEIREFEEMTTYEGGNEYFVQGALVPVRLIEDYIMSKSAKQENQPDAQAEQKMREDIKAELREVLQKTLNGHYKDVASILD